MKNDRADAGKGGDRLDASMPQKLLESALAVAAAAAGVARHVVWYLSYQVNGSARDGEFSRRSGDRSGQ